MNRRQLGQHAGRVEQVDIWGAWIPFVAMLAPKDKPIALADHDRLIHRLETALENLRTAPRPTRWAWRDISDMVNFLQSLIELEWATDEGGHIEAAKQALFDSAQSLEHHGTIRLNGPGLTALREALDQFTELTRAMSAHSFWRAVKHTKDRVQSLLKGAKKRGDVVVSI